MSAEISPYEKNMGGEYREFVNEYYEAEWDHEDDKYDLLIVVSNCLPCYDVRKEGQTFSCCEYCEKVWCDDHVTFDHSDPVCKECKEEYF